MLRMDPGISVPKNYLYTSILNWTKLKDFPIGRGKEMGLVVRERVRSLVDWNMRI